MTRNETRQNYVFRGGLQPLELISIVGITHPDDDAIVLGVLGVTQSARRQATGLLRVLQCQRLSDDVR